MRIAIPLVSDQFCPHFGRCEAMYLAEVDLENKTFDRPRIVQRTSSGCESLPNWLKDLAVELIIAGGIGAGARENLSRFGVQVVWGFTGQIPEDVLQQYMDNPQGSENSSCDHHDHDHHHCKH